MSDVIASKALVHISAHPENGTISRQYYMDLSFKGENFHCKLSTPARLVTPDKKVFIYLVIDASHVQNLVVCDNHKEAIPADIINAFVKQARCTGPAEIMSMQLTLKRNAPLVSPESTLQKRPSSCNAIDALLRLGQCETFKIYVPSQFIRRERLSGVCNALAQGTLKPASEVIKSLYAGAGGKIITHLDELWNLYSLESPPAYDAATAPGASNDEAAGRQDVESTSNARARGKRRITSPGSHETSAKRQLLTEKAAPEPWELAIAAQSVQLAALNAQLMSLREEMQQLRRAPAVDAGTQTAAHFELERHSSPALCQTSPSQASTIENTIEDRLMMVEDSLIDEQKRRKSLEEKLDSNDERVRQTLDLECDGLQHAISGLESRVNDVEDDLQDDLRQEFEDALDEKSLEIQIKLEELIEHRLEEVEEVVKNDVRIAMENASYKFKMDLNWVE